MLSRILLIAICALGVFSGCSHSKESNLVGSWRGNINEMAGEVRFASDHTFASREWDATNLLSAQTVKVIAMSASDQTMKPAPRKAEE